MRLPRLQFGLRALFVVMTAAAVMAWWPNYGRPLYEARQARLNLRRAIHLGDPEGFVLSLERIESLRLVQPEHQHLWQPGEIGPPEPLTMDEKFAEECTELLAHDSAKVRVLAALAVSLIRRQPEQELPLLTALLDDPSVEVRAAAAYGLKCYERAAQPMFEALVKVVKAARQRRRIDSTAAFETLLELDSFATMQALELGGISYLHAVPGRRPSLFADRVLGEIYPRYRQASDLRFEQEWLEKESRDCKVRLSACTDVAERDACRDELDTLQAELERLRAQRAACRAAYGDSN
ncbi:MAG TPA: hypothetical protein VJ783_24215 [Pirellulales bacterium]|nr:hypothetical protein [Pirellulales bacterium]